MQFIQIENPESDFAPNAELNRGWALHEKALIAKRDSRLEEAASLQEASHLAMENFRIQARQLPSDHPQKPKRELETLDSYLHEGNMEGLAAEAARQGEVYKTDSSRFVASMLYLGIAHLKRSEPDYEAACEALLLVLNTDIIPKTYDEVLATHSAVWLLQSSMNVENISYGQAAYSYIKYSLPESPLRTQALSDFSHFDSEAQ
jgi:hypothetical protein